MKLIRVWEMILMAVTIRFEYSGQGKKWSYIDCREVTDGLRSVTLFLTGADTEELEKVAVAMQDAMGDKGWNFTNYDGLQDCYNGKWEITLMSDDLSSPEEAEYMKDDYKEVKKSVLAQMKRK